jgi:glucan 1,3-beta-glucosidase
MGLESSWDDSAQANDQVPPLNKPFGYGKQPIRGVNIGGWLSLEPFITPSLFDFPSLDNVVDEYTLTQKLGPSAAATTLEKHYATFVTDQTFSDIKNAGMDHVRIPYSYWAVTTYPGDPYVPKISWRYLLRGIEYARKYGLRVNLDLHALPGSQNGWNHSGRQGVIGWLNGTDGALNAQRSLDLHKQLSAFFAQDRYKNVVALYGLVNEPKMIELPVDSVLAWTTSAIEIVRNNGMQQIIAFADGFLGLENWKGKLQGVDDHMVLDAHQYVIFNTQQINLPHEDKINFACSGWGSQMAQSNSPATG